MKRRAALLAFSLAALCASRADALICHPILGCSCTVTGTDVSFGSFTPLAAAPQYATGDVSVDCTGVIDLAPSVSVRLDDGLWGAFAARKMRAAGGEQIDYNIFTTAQHSVVWGDGTGGSSAVTLSGGILSLGHWTADRTMYARALPSVTAKPAAYSDTVVVRIDW